MRYTSGNSVWVCWSKNRLLIFTKSCDACYITIGLLNNNNFLWNLTDWVVKMWWRFILFKDICILPAVCEHIYLFYCWNTNKFGLNFVYGSDQELDDLDEIRLRAWKTLCKCPKFHTTLGRRHTHHTCAHPIHSFNYFERATAAFEPNAFNLDFIKESQ